MDSVVKTGKTVDEAVNAALVELECTLDEVSIEILEEAKGGFLGFGARDAVVRVTRRTEATLPDFLSMQKPAPAQEPEPAQEVAPEAEKAPVEEPARVEPSSETTSTARETEVEASPATASTASEAVMDEGSAEEPTVSEEWIAAAAEEHNEAPSRARSDESVAATAESVSAASPETALDAQNIEEFAAEWLLNVLEQMHIDAQVSCDRGENGLYLEISGISEEDTGIVIGRRAETLNALQYLLGIAVNRRLGDHLRVFVDVGGYRGRRKASIEKMALRNAEKVQRFKRSIALEPMNAYERRIVHFALQNTRNITTVSEGREPLRKVVIKYTR